MGICFLFLFCRRMPPEVLIILIYSSPNLDLHNTGSSYKLLLSVLMFIETLRSLVGKLTTTLSSIFIFFPVASLSLT